MAGTFQYREMEYIVHNMDVMDQAILVKKLLPLYSVFGKLAVIFDAGAEGHEAAIADAARSFAALPDDDMRYIMRTCLKAVSRKIGGGQQLVWNEAAGRPQFADLKLPELISICVNVIKQDLGDFFPASGETSPDLPAK